MNISYERIAAVRPANTNEQDLYALTNGEAMGIIHVCNQDSTDRTYNIAITDAGTGVAASGEDWIRYEIPLLANLSHIVIIPGIKATSTIRIQASVADKISFVFMGQLKA